MTLFSPLNGSLSVARSCPVAHVSFDLTLPPPRDTAHYHVPLPIESYARRGQSKKGNRGKCNDRANTWQRERRVHLQRRRISMGLFKKLLVDNQTMRVELLFVLGARVYWKIGGQRVHMWRQQADLFRRIAKAMAGDPAFGENLELLFDYPVFRQWAELWGAHVIGTFRGQDESLQFFSLSFDDHRQIVLSLAEDAGRMAFRQRFSRL
jgi:hypothetical protein